MGQSLAQTSLSINPGSLLTREIRDGTRKLLQASRKSSTKSAKRVERRPGLMHDAWLIAVAFSAEIRTRPARRLLPGLRPPANITNTAGKRDD